MDAYDELAANPAATLARLNPAHQDDSVNCPQTADVVDNYLNTNTVVPVTNGYFDSFRISANWNNPAQPLHPAPNARRPARRTQPRRLALGQLVQQLRTLGHGHHYVIRGNRRANATGADGQPVHQTQNGQLITTTHYFVLANIRDRIWVIDAYRRTWSTNAQQYYQQEHFESVDYASEYETAAAGHY